MITAMQPSPITLCALVALVSACATIAEPPPKAVYANPVLDMDFPDPAVLKASDGFTYVYATQGEIGGAMRNLRVGRSTNLVDWEVLGDALPVKPGWASRTQDFWAPHAIESEGLYYLYYSAKPDAAIDDPTKGLCLAVATAERAEGPFVDSGKPLLCGPGFVNIDPMAFDDRATGRLLLYWGSGFEAIKVQELGRDRLSFAPGSAPVELVSPVKSDDPQEYRRLVEGAWVIRRGEYYYLFTSGDNCCGPKAHYAVMVARSRNATGPFESFAGASGPTRSVILEQGNNWVAPGHNAIVRDARGDDWILYHAVDKRKSRSKDSDEINTRRIMLIDPIVWRNGWPRVEANRGSTGPRPAPAVADGGVKRR